MKLLRSELTKLLLQKRTYVGWIGMMIIPALIVLALAFAGNAPGPGGGSAQAETSFFTLAGDNGLLVPLATIAMLITVLLPLLASMAGGYQLAGEAESGTIKTWLVHPVERGSVLASKWVTTVLYIFAGLALVAAVSYAAGIAAFGAKAPELLSGGTVSVAHGLWLTLLAYLYIGFAMTCVASVAMLLSTITDSSLTAAIGTLVLVIALQIVGALSYFDFLKPYLFTTYFDTWQGLFQGTIDWAPLLKGLAAFGAYSGVAMGASWYVFRRKDIAV